MKVLVTGHHGYIGSVMVPVLARAGHEVDRPRHVLLRGLRPLRPRRRRCRLDGSTSATSGPRHLEGFDAVVHLAGALERPARRPRPRADAARSTRRDRRARRRAATEAGVARFVFASSCSMYGAATGDEARRRDRAARAADRVRRVEGAKRRRRLLELARTRLLARLHAERDRLRRLAAAAARPRAQQPRRLGAHDGQGADPERRHALAAARPRPRRRAARRALLLEAPRELVHGEAFNVGARRRELPGARPRRDRPRDRARELRGRVRRQRRPRPAQLPRRLRQARADVSRLPLRVDGPPRRRASSSTRTARAGLDGPSSRASATPGSSASAGCSRTARSTTSLRWRS